MITNCFMPVRDDLCTNFASNLNMEVQKDLSNTVVKVKLQTNLACSAEKTDPLVTSCWLRHYHKIFQGDIDQKPTNKLSFKYSVNVQFTTSVFSEVS